MDEVGVILRNKICLLNVSGAMKGDVYMQFVVIKFISLS